MDAGKTYTTISVCFVERDHPRGCGENRLRAPSPHGKMGSPPQVRGKLSRSFGVKTVCRITPAGAGKTGEARAAIAKTRDHPRRCGENPAGVYDDNCADRITPAGAGKTLQNPCGCNRARDHPRRCGENPSETGAQGCRAGSPPQVRGKPSGASTNTATSRITPAGAGKTAL